ncbi:hypothetical protein [Comamonas fluminis]|uniref:hypothetical protein n=1 Tax=Comamonas fluminis TaxID=2796366 RepID=UPI001FE34516|nr:hypothetical protein [Comamonas fluminis]
MPTRFGPRHTIYMRLYRWAHSGVLVEVLSHLQQDRLSQWCVQALSLDSTIVKVHPDGCGARKKRSTSHRQEPGWLEQQDSHGGRQLSRCFGMEPDSRPSR